MGRRSGADRRGGLHRRVAVARFEGGEELPSKRVRERVALLGPVQREPADLRPRVVDHDEFGFAHASLLAARYEGTAGEHTAVYFEAKEGRGGYYRPDGTSVEREFLMAPLRHARISSSYSPARRHPILKVTRPHYGIDYAAPMGAPVWAVADGSFVQGDAYKIDPDTGMYDTLTGLVGSYTYSDMTGFALKNAGKPAG